MQRVTDRSVVGLGLRGRPRPTNMPKPVSAGSAADDNLTAHVFDLTADQSEAIHLHRLPVRPIRDQCQPAAEHVDAISVEFFNVGNILLNRLYGITICCE